MFQWRLFLVLLRPSATSTTATFILITLFFGILAHNYVTENNVIYDALSQAITSPERELGGAAGATNNTYGGILEQSWLYNIMIFVGAIGVGVVVYMLLQLLSFILLKISSTLEEVKEGDTSTRIMVGRHIAMRMLFRIIFALIFITVLYLIVRLGLLYVIALFNESMDNLATPLGLRDIITAFIIAFLFVHTQVVLLRLVLLRPRIFGGTYVIAGLMQ